MASTLFVSPAAGADLAPLLRLLPACLSQGDSPAGDRFRVRDNIVGRSGPGAGFNNQQRKGEQA